MVSEICNKLTAIVAILGLTAICITALIRGVDGMVVGGTMASVSALGGVSVGSMLQKQKLEGK